MMLRFEADDVAESSEVWVDVEFSAWGSARVSKEICIDEEKRSGSVGTAKKRGF